MAKTLKRVFKFKFSFLKGFDANSKKVGKEIAKNISELGTQKLEGARNYTSRLSDKIGGKPGIDPTLKNFSKNFLINVEKRFVYNPKHWKPLSRTTKIIRGYLLNPENFVYKVMKWWNAGQKGGQIAEKPTITLHKLKLDPRMMNDRPSLLRSGRLMRAIRITLRKKNSKSKSGNSWKFIHQRVIGFKVVGAPYWRKQFFGGTGRAYSLKKKFKTKDGKEITVDIPIPNEFYTDIRLRMSQLSKGEYKLEKRMIHIPGRNPLYFDTEDVSELNNLIVVLGDNITKGLEEV